MNLYEIDSRLNELLERGFNDECVDAETGEIDEEKVAQMIDELALARDEKIEAIVCYVKNIEHLADDIKAEEKALAERRKSKENKAESLRKYLASVLNGQKFETAKCAIGWRKSEQVVIADGTELPEEYQTVKYTLSPNKTALKEALKQGIEIDGVALEIKNNMQIK